MTRTIVRVEKSGENKGTVLGVFDEVEDRSGMITMIDLGSSEHVQCMPEWYLRKTRPATPEEEARFCEWYEPKYGSIELVKRRTPKY